jgi:hypothetical protein
MLRRPLSSGWSTESSRRSISRSLSGPVLESLIDQSNRKSGTFLCNALDADAPAAKMRMFSTAMTPVAVLRRVRIGIGRCPLWRRCAGVVLSEGRGWGRGDHYQSTQDQGATHGPDVHIRLHVTKNKDSNRARDERGVGEFLIGRV